MSLKNAPFIDELIDQLDGPNVLGFSVVGSYARHENNKYSDIDLDIFVNELPSDTYTLRLFNEKLVSLKYILLQDEYDSLKKPESAVWAAPGLSQMQILKDETGQIQKLKQTALDFKWTDLQPAANEYAIEKLMGCSEEAHKIMGGLVQNHESKVLYASWGMFKELSFAVLVQAGLMIDSENRAFDIIQNHLGRDHIWTRAFRLSFGMDTGDSNIPVYQTRGKASLELYVQTAILFKNVITDLHREVIEDTLQMIREYQKG